MNIPRGNSACTTPVAVRPVLQNKRRCPAPLAPRSEEPQGASTDLRIYHFCDWLNTHLLQRKLINSERIDSLATVSHFRAMEVLDELQSCSAKIRNPNRFIKAAVRREVEGSYVPPQPRALSTWSEALAPCHQAIWHSARATRERRLRPCLSPLYPLTALPL